ncbi:MAG: sulfur transferase domain-containing protein [Pseudomonadota bacterium]
MARKKPNITREDMLTREGRRRAWRGLVFADHGFLRYIYSNIHQVSDNMWRSFQPAPLHLKRFKQKGVKTVINLRGQSNTGFYRLEEESCERLGMALVNLKLHSRDIPKREQIHAARNLFQSIEYPAVMHCKSGADRAGMGAVLYLFLHERRPLAEAREQLSLRYGHMKQGKTGVLDYYWDKAEEAGATTPEDFLAWVDSDDYDPAALKAGFMGQWWANILTDKILRRE